MNEDTFAVALARCFFCGEANEIVINRLLTRQAARQVREMDGKVIGLDPCPKCHALMEQGVILLTFDPAHSDPDWYKQALPNPYRTGGFFVLRDEAVKQILEGCPELAAWALDHRWMFIEHDAAVQIGLFEAAAADAAGE